MAKQRQVMHMFDCGKEYRVIKYYGKDNPYHIYQYVNVPDEYGFIREKRILLAKYACLNSCLWWFVQNNIGLS